MAARQARLTPMPSQNWSCREAGLVVELSMLWDYNHKLVVLRNGIFWGGRRNNEL
jgi:hypothetical protein